MAWGFHETVRICLSYCLSALAAAAAAALYPRPFHTQLPIVCDDQKLTYCQFCFVWVLIVGLGLGVLFLIGILIKSVRRCFGFPILTLSPPSRSTLSSPLLHRGASLAAAGSSALPIIALSGRQQGSLARVRPTLPLVPAWRGSTTGAVGRVNALLPSDGDSRA